MNTCPYCATEIFNNSCCFCCYEGQPQQNGKRNVQKTMKSIVFIDHAIKGVSELIQYHTYDLLVCLRLIRAERSQVFDTLRGVNKMFDAITENEALHFKEVQDDAGSMYEYWTRKAWVIENILMDRMGYFPDRIDDKMLIRVKESSLKAQAKVMRISKERKDKVRSI